MSEHAPLLEAYLNGELDDQGFVAFNAWLREDPEHLREWAVAAFLAQELGEVLSEQHIATPQPAVTDKASAAERGLMDAEVLDLLQQIEASSHDAPLRDLTNERKAQPKQTRQRSSDAIDFGTAVRELSWAAGKVARHLIVSKPAVLTGLAAMLVIGMVVALSFLGGPDDSNQSDPLAVAPQDEPAAVAAASVATLTATHNAKWSSDSAGGASPLPVPGTQLQAGDRLTLTAGFAEITTHDGAIAILEAPATIELLDNDNALRLHAGKLFGICETESSIGFTVHTPRARIVDLGTEFGVEARLDGVTTVQVYKGEVQAAEIQPDGEIGEFVSVFAQQAFAIHAETGLQKDTFDPGRHQQDVATAAMRPEPELGEMWWRGDPARLTQAERVKSEAMQVLIEKSGVLLEQDIPVDLNWPGRWLSDAPEQKAAVVKAGERVDVYLVHFDPVGGVGFDKQGQFTIRFGGQILGVICDSESLAQAPGVIRSEVRYPEAAQGNGGPGLELEFGDRVQIHPNRTSLVCELAAATFYDQMLVLVRSTDE